MSQISPQEFHQRLSEQNDLLVVDVRTPGEFARAHVAHAQNIPLDLLQSGAIPNFPTTQPIYLLCESGKRAAIASGLLTKNQPIVVEGGTRAWRQAGFPVESTGAGVISLERQVRIGAGSLVVLGVILAVTVHPAFIALSGLVGAGLIFAGVTDICGMALLLARLPWNRHA